MNEDRPEMAPGDTSSETGAGQIWRVVPRPFRSEARPPIPGALFVAPMTLGRIAVALGIVALWLWGFLATGSLLVGMGLLAAPLPGLLVFGLHAEWADWTVGDVCQRGRGDAAVETDLDRTLRPPVEPVRFEDDGALLLPDCPPLATPVGGTESPVTPPFRTGPLNVPAQPSLTSPR